MDENKKLEDQVNEVFSQISTGIKKGAEVVSGYVSQQTEILKLKGDINQAKKDLKTAYEQFGHGVYEEEILKKPFENKPFLLDQIQTKEKLVELLEEKLGIKEGK
ncbi:MULTISPECIES: hypothetical protein [Terrabacteria group]|uniref:hypothetical protein n=1 Tax=Bacillati TaxID=1783272 RepID=UPI00193ACD4C|nr:MULTISPECIES: hypothetical protein [Terrabacteria group]MBW9212020.1 hypothetical protein [Trueperella sp. zg.1013]QRG87173.1 hypothetical protein JOS54_02370 [Bulleidia sp. zg-1006]